MAWVKEAPAKPDWYWVMEPWYKYGPIIWYLEKFMLERIAEDTLFWDEPLVPPPLPVVEDPDLTEKEKS